MPCNILSLDGGGSWALLEAQTLGELYGPKTPGQKILSNFQFAVSNSGGSIVLAGLALNFTPEQLVDLFNDQKKREKIFVRDPLSHLTGFERYQADKKLPGLQNVLGAASNQLLDQINLGSPCKLLIAAFDYNRLRVQFFRSDSQSPAAGSNGSSQPTIAEAAHASSNAPIKYFDAPAEFQTPAFAGYRYWDGAISGFNNPVLAGITEALAYGHAPKDLRVLSIGTANVFLPMPQAPLPDPGAYGQNPLCVHINSSGFLHDTQIMATTILDDPPDQASFVGHLLTSGAAALSQDPAHPVTNGNLVRLNPWIQPVGGPANWVPPKLLAYAGNLTSVTSNYADDASAFDALVNLDMDAVDQDEVDLIITLGRAWIAGDVPNQSIRATRDLEPLIGHGKFAAAVAQARAFGLA